MKEYNNNIIEKVFSFLLVIFNPNYGIMNEVYNEEWNDKLLELMDKHKFIIIDRFYVKLGDQIIWIANHPYASFICPLYDVRPSRRTIYKAHRKLMRDSNKTVREMEA